MTTEPQDGPSPRRRLLDAAARLLATQGPESVSQRNVAQQAGISTMGIYTHFGGMAHLVAAIVEEGFARLAERMSAIPTSVSVDDDVVALSMAFLEHGRENPHLYRVMFGSAPLGRFGPLRTDQMQAGRRGTIDTVVDRIEQGIAAGEIAERNAWHLANQWFAAIHGYTMLELSGYIREADGVDKVLRPLLTGVLAGFTAQQTERSDP